MTFDPNCCRLDIPYPGTNVCATNSCAAALLTTDLAGQVSEMSAIVSYIYQHQIVADDALANALECISMVEMKHYELIGELIVGFGGCPRLSVLNGCRNCWWSGQFATYETDPVCFLKENIRNERAAINGYTAQIAQLEDECAIAVLERIILDEKHHIEIFQSFLSQLQTGCSGCL